MTKEKIERAVTLGAEVAGVPGVGHVLDLVRRATSRAAQRRFSRWMEDVAASTEFGDRESLWATIDKHMDEEWVHENVTQSVLGLMNLLDPALIPTFAAVSADYLTGRRVPDLFFRRTCRLLGDLTSVELPWLSRVVSELAEGAKTASEITINVFFAHYYVSWFEHEGRRAEDLKQTARSSTDRGFHRLCELLAYHGFGGLSWVYGPKSFDDEKISYTLHFGPEQVRVAERLARLVVL